MKSAQKKLIFYRILGTYAFFILFRDRITVFVYLWRILLWDSLKILTWQEIFSSEQLFLPEGIV